MKYNPALDGLRAVAILLVLACHTAGRAFPGGWVGVDVFFVLSGYLITSILLRELRTTGRIDIGSFYWRRALRLLPALGLLCVFQLVRSMFSANGAEIREATLGGALYLENWNAVYHWWDPALMDHTWSLAVEEQFYLMWPLLLPLLFLRGLWWAAAAVCALATARVVCWRLGYAEATLDFSMLRPVGLLVGCALAFGQRSAPGWVGTAALCVVVAVAVVVGRSPVVFAVAPIVVSLATAVVVMGSPGWLAAAPLRYLGRISYGVYLYHWPVFILGEKLKPAGFGHVWAVGLVVLIVALAALSYEFVEKPVLRLRSVARLPVVVAAG